MVLWQSAERFKFQAITLGITLLQKNKIERMFINGFYNIVFHASQKLKQGLRDHITQNFTNERGKEQINNLFKWPKETKRFRFPFSIPLDLNCSIQGSRDNFSYLFYTEYRILEEEKNTNDDPQRFGLEMRMKQRLNSI